MCLYVPACAWVCPGYGNHGSEDKCPCPMEIPSGENNVHVTFTWHHQLGWNTLSDYGSKDEIVLKMAILLLKKTLKITSLLSWQSQLGGSKEEFPLDGETIG